ncbi:hypothetical protein [Pectobacterium versatile]|uniref:hypothetical protein n=1 Tax=Pectobacterium versatile TaxID=2488639 RepID=UPI0032EF2B2E
MKQYRALSIVYPAVQHIMLGIKKVEIRSWIPPEIPMKDLVLIENYSYLHDGEIDLSGKALAIVDVVNYSEWRREDFLNQSNNTKIGKKWKNGYYMWHLENIRIINNEFNCTAKKGIYNIAIDELKTTLLK